MLAAFDAKFSNTGAGFPSERLLATPTFLIPLAPPASQHNRWRPENFMPRCARSGQQYDRELRPRLFVEFRSCDPSVWLRDVLSRCPSYFDSASATLSVIWNSSIAAFERTRSPSERNTI